MSVALPGDRLANRQAVTGDFSAAVLDACSQSLFPVNQVAKLLRAREFHQSNHHVTSAPTLVVVDHVSSSFRLIISRAFSKKVCLTGGKTHCCQVSQMSLEILRQQA